MAIQKPEWFKMDPAKFLSDSQVDVMTTPELGACFRLMCRQWIDGFIPDDQYLLARLCRLDAGAMAEAWVTLSQFFPVVAPGKRANRFMWIEREKVVADLERRSDEGTRAANKRWEEARKKRETATAGDQCQTHTSPIPLAMQDQSRPDQTRPALSQTPFADPHEVKERHDSDTTKIKTLSSNPEGFNEAVLEVWDYYVATLNRSPQSS